MPFGVSGMAWSLTNCAGTMKAGSRSPTKRWSADGVRNVRAGGEIGHQANLTRLVLARHDHGVANVGVRA